MLSAGRPDEEFVEPRFEGRRERCAALMAVMTHAPVTADINLPYPVQVDLVQDPVGWTYRESQTELPLYMSVADPPGRSVCNDGCAKKWIPLSASSDVEPLGEWTIILRNDGRRQWAFEGRAVYTNVNDTPTKTTGVGDGWYLMPHFRLP